MKTIIDGSCRLLGECIDLLGNAADHTVIVGGWGPYLRHRDRHPGTRDVDILFPINYSEAHIRDIVQPFLEAGFFLSAKHDFQVFRQYQIGAHTYIFNVDLLHPVIQRTNRCEFMDIIDLDIKIDGRLAKTVQTICLENGDAIFDPDEPLTSVEEYEGRNFRLLNGAGVVVTKINSCHNPKRPRDIFDIYLSVDEGEEVFNTVRRLCLANSGFRDSVENFKLRLESNWEFYETSLQQYGVVDTNQAKAVLTEMASPSLEQSD